MHLRSLHPFTSPWGFVLVRIPPSLHISLGGCFDPDPSIPSYPPWGLFWSGSLHSFTSPLGFVLLFYSPQLVKTRTSKIGELSNYVR